MNTFSKYRSTCTALVASALVQIRQHSRCRCELRTPPGARIVDGWEHGTREQICFWCARLGGESEGRDRFFDDLCAVGNLDRESQVKLDEKRGWWKEGLNGGRE